jgi:trk system potassium uptake protein TrkA
VHVVVIGCGRVGSELAGALEQAGHTVAVVDKVARAFRRLPQGFTGTTVVGFGFDRDHLHAAGIDKAGAFASVTSGDNSNILCARIARETYGIERVVARIYDPRRALIYQRLGIPTVATVRWTADQMLRRLLPQGSVPEHTDPSGRVVVAEVPLHQSWIGRPLTEIEGVAGARVAYLTRLGEGLLPGTDMVYQDGDLVHLVTHTSSLATVEHQLDQPPPVH